MVSSSAATRVHFSSKYMQWLEVDKTDPITGKPVDVGAIVKVKDPSEYLNAYNASKGPDDEDGDK